MRYLLIPGIVFFVIGLIFLFFNKALACLLGRIGKSIFEDSETKFNNFSITELFELPDKISTALIVLGIVFFLQGLAFFALGLFI